MTTEDELLSESATEALAAGMALSLTASYARAREAGPVVLDGLSAWSAARMDETADPLNALGQFWQWRNASPSWHHHRRIMRPEPELEVTETAGDVAADSISPRYRPSLDSFWVTDRSGRQHWTKNDYYPMSIASEDGWVPDPAADPRHTAGVSAQRPPVVRGGAQGSAQVEAGMRVYNDLGHEFLAHGMFVGWRKTISTIGEVSVGDSVEVRESSTSQHWQRATVIGVSQEGIKVHYSGLDSSFDGTIHPKTTRLRRKPPRDGRLPMHSGRLWPTHAPASPALAKRGQRRPPGQPATFLKPRDRKLFDDEKRRQIDARVSSAVLRVETNQLKAKLLRSALGSVEKVCKDGKDEKKADPLGLGSRQLVAELVACWRERAQASHQWPQGESGLEGRRLTDNLDEYFQASLEAWKSEKVDDSEHALEPAVPQQQFGEMQEKRKHADQVLYAEVSSQAVVDAARMLRTQPVRAPVAADPRRQAAVSTARAVQIMEAAKPPPGAIKQGTESTATSLEKPNTPQAAILESSLAEIRQVDAEKQAQLNKNTRTSACKSGDDGDDKATEALLLEETDSIKRASSIVRQPQPPSGGRNYQVRTFRGQDQQAWQEKQQRDLEKYFPGMFEASAPPQPPEHSRTGSGQKHGSGTPSCGVLGLPLECTAAGQVALTPRNWKLNHLQRSD